MSASSKAKGTRFESETSEFLQSQGVRAKRLPRTGVKDIGDVAFPITIPGRPWGGTIVLECKNRASMDLPTYLKEAEEEAANYEEKYPSDGTAMGVAVVKRRGKGVHQAYVVMPLDGFVELLREMGAV